MNQGQQRIYVCQKKGTKEKAVEKNSKSFA